MNKVVLYGLSFFTNAVVLVFEIVGGRLLAPYLGTAVGVWAGLISVVLGGMALGYHWGGKIADKHASKEIIGRFLFASGLAALIAWSVRDIVPTIFAVTGLPETFGALIVGAVLFMPTVFILAAISPLLAKNLITNMEHSARTVGTLNAVGSLGSILGAVLTGAFLIPYFGVSTILLSIAIFLFFLSLFFIKKDFFNNAGLALLVIALAGYFNALPTRANTALDEVATNYNRVFIDQINYGGEALALSMDPFGTQCAMFIENGVTDETSIVFPYLKAFDILRETTYPQGAPRALFLGGCNYSYPRYLSNIFPAMTADIVEIDRGMTTIAEKYFGFKAENFPSLKIFHQDARMYLKEPHEKYDVIFMDTFGSSKGIPVHLTTKEMFESIEENLSKDGYLFINGHGAYRGEGSRFPSALLQTVKEVFPYVSVYGLGNPSTQNQNLIFVASYKNELPQRLTSERFGGEVTMMKLTLPESEIIFTDDFAPVERLMN